MRFTIHTFSRIISVKINGKTNLFSSMFHYCFTKFHHRFHFLFTAYHGKVCTKERQI